MSAQSVSVPTCPGANRSVTVPSPNCPNVFVPHVQTVPFVFNATTCRSPTHTFFQFVSVPTRTNELETRLV